MLFKCAYLLSTVYLLQGVYCQVSDNAGHSGPRFLRQPQDTFILQSDISYVTLDCVADSVPQPTYEWIKFTADNRTVSVNNYDSLRFFFYYGSLIIENATLDDEGIYQCKASNIYGTIISTQAQLTILKLGEFSNVLPPPTVALEFDGAVLECPIMHFSHRKSVLNYRWYKDTVSNWINPDAQNSMFISANGKLFISEVSPQDTGKYYCQVTLSTSLLDGNIIGNNELKRTALPIDVRVVSSDPSMKHTFTLPTDFLYAQPSTPLKGSRLRLECFAYGTGQLYYTWSREHGKSLPANSSLESNNRVLLVDNIGLDDGGEYTCDVYSTSLQLSYRRSKNITIEAKPYFTLPLTDQLLESGSRLTWRCEADGIPAPTYTWYKNGEVLRSSSRMEVDMKTLTIAAVDDREDNGMYQCEARNKHGSIYSTAELQVSSYVGCFGCSSSDIISGSWKLFSMMITMILLII